jgi:hypothetical protein
MGDGLLFHRLAFVPGELEEIENWLKRLSKRHKGKLIFAAKLFFYR